MKRVSVLFLSLTFFLSAFFMLKTVHAEMVETDIESFEYFEDLNIVDLTHGYDFSSALTDEGRLFMWGANYSGMLGDGSTINRFSPVEITKNFDLLFDESIIKVDFGESFSVALTNKGRVFTWGDNSTGTLGDGTFDTSLLPVDITDNFNLSIGDVIVDINIGLEHCSALSSSGQLYTWGSNDYGMLGDNSGIDQENPVNITSNLNLATGEEIDLVSLGADYTMVTTTLGRLLVWGSDSDGEFGDGADNSTSATPVDVTTHYNLNGGETIVILTTGFYSGMIVTSLGRVITWGESSSGQSGNDTTDPQYSPVDITSRFNFGAGEVIVQSQYGDSYYIALTNQNRVFAWGYNGDGQVGTGTIDDQLVPYDMTSNLNLDTNEIVLSVSGGAYTTGVLTSEGVYLWGYNYYGGIGDGTNDDSLTPVDITDNFNSYTIFTALLEPGETIIDSSTGDSHFVVVTSLGKVYTWGQNTYGQLGYTSTESNNLPVNITDSLNLDASEKVISVSAGADHTLILTDNGTVYTWGLNNRGQLGDNTNDNSDAPIELSATLFNNEAVIKISAGDEQSSAITNLGTVYTWGFNWQGQMGDGTEVNKSVPTDITANFGLNIGETITKISHGLYHTIAMTSEGRIFTWGYSNLGQLGTETLAGTAEYVTLPVELPLTNFNDETIIDIDAGTFHSMAITDSGVVYGWGHNGVGQLGSGDTTLSNVPQAIEQSYFNDEPVIKVSVGDNFSSVTTSSGDLYTFGGNLSGVLGIGINYTQLRPVKVLNELDDEIVYQVSCGYDSMMVVTLSGNLYTTGRRAEGPNGDEHLTFDNLPILQMSNQELSYIYLPYYSEYYTDTMIVSVFPKYNISSNLYSITINGQEYFSDSITVSDGRIDVEIIQDGSIDSYFQVAVEYLSFEQGTQVETVGYVSNRSILMDLEAPTFSQINTQTIEVGTNDIDWTSFMTNVEDNSNLFVTLEEVIDNVDYDTLGTYSVTVKATDISLNDTMMSFNVEVVDTTLPMITLIGDSEIYLEVGDTYIEAGATYTDNYDASGNAIVSGSVDTSLVGTYTIAYNVIDSSSNQAIEVTRTVYVEDTTKPIITLTGDNEIYLELGDAYSEQGANYTDNYDISGSALVSGTVNINVIGTYIIEYDIEDSSGNQATTVTRTVIVQDTTDPIVDGITNNEVFARGSEVTISFNEGTASLNGETVLDGTVVSESGDYVLVVTDASNNVTTLTFSIEAGFNFVIIVYIAVGAALIAGGVIAFMKFKH